MASAIQNNLKDSILFGNKGYIYVHKDVDDFGTVETGAYHKTVDAVEKYYKSKKRESLQASKTQFTNLFLKNANIPSEILGQLYDQCTGKVNDELMKIIQTHIANTLQKNLNINSLNWIMQRYKETEKINIAKLIEENISQDGINQYNELIKLLNKSFQKFFNSSINLTSLGILSSVSSTKGMTRKELGEELGNYIENLREKIKVQGLYMNKNEIEKLEHILDRINILAIDLKNGFFKTKKGNKSLTEDGIKIVIEAIFNTGFGEACGALFKTKATDIIYDTIKLIGGTGYSQVLITDPSGKKIETQTVKQTAPGKVDLKLENMKFKIKTKNHQEGFEIMTDVGISEKFYRKGAFFNGTKFSSGQTVFDLGSGGNLLIAIQNMFGTKNFYLYDAYNTIVKGNQSAEWQRALMNFQDVLLSRQIIRLLSSRGGAQDFASILLVNGKVIPIWDIILSLENSIGLSVSQIKNEEKETQIGQTKQSVALHIQGRNNIIKLGTTKTDNPKERIVEVNKALSKATIKGKLYLKGLYPGDMFSS